MSPEFRIAAIGEILWDLLPEGPQLGGAPANFAVTLQALSASSASSADAVFLVGRVGNDALGRRALDSIAARSVNTEHISVDPEHPTGTVTVHLDAEAVATYHIEENAAWDHIPQTPQLLALAPLLDAVCFGTLAQRSPVTRTTLRRLVESVSRACIRIFDVNLRSPYWCAETIAWGCRHATILKMNHDEVEHVAHALGIRGRQDSPVQVAREILDRCPARLVAITRGPQGSLLVTRQQENDHPGVEAAVVDTIGAGDAFTAALAYSALRNLPLERMAELANRWGAWVASRRGGMPQVDDASKRLLATSMTIPAAAHEGAAERAIFS